MIKSFEDEHNQNSCITFKNSERQTCCFGSDIMQLCYYFHYFFYLSLVFFGLINTSSLCRKKSKESDESIFLNSFFLKIILLFICMYIFMRGLNLTLCMMPFITNWWNCPLLALKHTCYCFHVITDWIISKCIDKNFVSFTYEQYQTFWQQYN